MKIEPEQRLNISLRALINIFLGFIIFEMFGQLSLANFIFNNQNM